MNFFNYFLQSVGVWPGQVHSPLLSESHDGLRRPFYSGRRLTVWGRYIIVLFHTHVCWLIFLGRWTVASADHSSTHGVIADGDCLQTRSFEDHPPLTLLSRLFSRSSILSSVVLWYSWSTTHYGLFRLIRCYPRRPLGSQDFPHPLPGTGLNTGVPQSEDYHCKCRRQDARQVWKRQNTTFMITLSKV